MAGQYPHSTKLAISFTRALSSTRTPSFHKHGLSALLIGRFIAFVRTLLPTIAGLSGLNNARFQFFNWMSGLLWVLILTTLGYMLGKTPVFLKYEDQLMSCLMLLPVVLLVFGLAGSLVVLWKRNMEIGVRDANTSHVASPASLVRRCLLLVGTLLLAWSAVRQQESTLAIRAVHQGTTMPDGFQSGITLTLTAFLSKVSPQK